MTIMSDMKGKGYPAGTFKMGQKIYHTKNVEHRFRFHKKCEYCDNTGAVLIKGGKFQCPACKGAFTYKEVIEKVIDNDDIDDMKIRSVLTFQNNSGTYEIYATESSGCGFQICKEDDGRNSYFSTEDEAQVACDEFNKENNVNLCLDEYKRAEIRGYL